MAQMELPVEIDAEFDELNSSEAIIVYSRDWTIETIVSQIRKGNINLNPKFQRRNAWKDDKRLRLVESLLLSYPVPEIVLAEDRDKKGAFIVIDGKQRLQTLAGLYLPEIYEVWDKKKFSKSNVMPALTNVSFEQFFNDDKNRDLVNALDNADIRCTVISNYKKDDVLYDIFYRLNTGSAPLSSQELRQVLNKGYFSEHLLQVTDVPTSLHKVLDITSADDRLVDVDLLLRSLAFLRRPDMYTGNQKQFLDNFVTDINSSWSTEKGSINNDIATVMKSIDFMGSLIGYMRIGRKITNGSFDWRFNKVLFEVQVLYSVGMDASIITEATKILYNEKLTEIMNDAAFRSSLESTTKSMDNYRNRFATYERMILSVFGGAVRYRSGIQ